MATNLRLTLSSDYHWALPCLIMVVFIFFLNAYAEMEPFVDATPHAHSPQAHSDAVVTARAAESVRADRRTAAHAGASDDEDVETFANYYKCGNATPSGIMKDIFATYDIYKTRGDQWELFLPCNYTHAERELRSLPGSGTMDTQATLIPSSTDQPRAIFAVDGCDQLVSKNRLWTLLVEAYGRARSETLMPATYVFTSAADVKQFVADYRPGAMYICKKNVQRKQGLLRTSNLDQILRAEMEGYKLVQAYEKDVFTVHRRKLNLRYYVLLVCDAYGRKQAYVHREGKCLYTARDYDADADDDAHHITSVGVTAHDYVDLPLTTNQLRAHLHTVGVEYDDVFRAVTDKLQHVVAAVMPSMCVASKFKHHLRFQLFGADVLLTSGLDPLVLELNKGPDMKPVNQDDYGLKRAVLEDTFRRAGFLPPSRSSGFVMLREMDVNGG